MITTIIFDFAGVVSKRRFFPVVAENLGKKYGIPKEKILESLSAHVMQYMLGKESTEDFWKKVCAGFDIPYNEFVKVFSSSYELNLNIIRLIQKLKENHQTLLLSDNFNALSQVLRKDVQLEGLFEKMYFSDEIHLTKEDKEMFLFVFKDIQKKPEECLFIDDQEKNIIIARSLGIKSLLFVNYETLLSEMKGLGTMVPDELG